MGSRDIKVGLFVLSGLIMAGLVIFLLGSERRFFSSAVDFKTTFQDVQGLKAGAPVRMGGIDIGSVAEVGYGEDPNDTTVYVTLSIVETEARRIRTDAVAEVANKGLLGDKMITITVGESDETLPPGAEIPGEEPQDMLGKVSGMADKAEVAIENIAEITEGLADQRLHEDIRGIASGLNSTLHHISEGEGYPHRFLTSPEEADRISRTLENLELVTTELNMTLAEARMVMQRVRTGPGFAHDVIYGDGPAPQIAQFGTAAEEVALTLRGIREGDGLAKDLLYGAEGDTDEMITNLTAITADVRTIVANVKEGKGTIGALLVDPSIYQDMKLVLGNVQRNDVLRALVRYSIKQDQPSPAVDVEAPPPPAATSPEASAP